MARNGWFIADSYGSRQIYITQIVHGMTIISDEYAARTHRTMHPWKQTSGSFDVEVQHPSYEEYVAFNEWMKIYVERIINPDNTKIGPMRIYCPARDFDKIAVPSSGIKFGRSTGEFMWTQTIGFKGASDPIDLESNDLTLISGAYASTYYEAGGAPGDYLSSYAIGSVGDAIFDRNEEVYDVPTSNPFFGGGGSGGTSGSGVR